jgi:hypothetical protein
VRTSGKKRTGALRRSSSLHFCRHSIWLRRSMRFSGTWPVRNMLQPMMGIRKLLVLEMN